MTIDKLINVLVTITLIEMMVAIGLGVTFADLAWEHSAGRPERVAAERDGVTLDMLRAAMAVHTPLERRPEG